MYVGIHRFSVTTDNTKREGYNHCNRGLTNLSPGKAQIKPWLKTTHCTVRPYSLGARKEKGKLVFK